MFLRVFKLSVQASELSLELTVLLFEQLIADRA